jgi:hypothetical protein
MRIYFKLAAMAVISSTALFTACKKDPKAGKGGKAVLKITAKHHGTVIDNCMIYIKYNTKDLPADKKFDDSAKSTWVNNTSVATFANLNKGDYYLYGVGYDSAIAQTVVGGSPYVISEETEQSYNISVTEGD